MFYIVSVIIIQLLTICYNPQCADKVDNLHRKASQSPHIYN